MIIDNASEEIATDANMPTAESMAAATRAVRDDNCPDAIDRYFFWDD